MTQDARKQHDEKHGDAVTSGPWVDIDLSALCKNFATIRKKTQSAETGAVVKCDGYGLGAGNVARALAAREECRSFFVAYGEEGAALRKRLQDVSPAPAIYVFSGVAAEHFDLFRDHALTPVLNTMNQARLWTSAFPGVPAAAMVETGINRAGLAPGDLTALANMADLNLEVLMSHLACAATPSHQMNARQRSLFAEFATTFPKARKSLAASAGSLMGADYHFDLLRPGIALYGASPFVDPAPELAPVATLRAPIMQLRRINAGETVGYDGVFKAARDSMIAVAAIGYGDGMPRSAGGRAMAFIDGALHPVVGRISMDMTTIDVTDAPSPPETGAVAEFYGPNLSINTAAAAASTIAYELLTGLGGRVDRRYV